MKLDERVDIFLIDEKRLPKEEETELDDDELNFEFFDGEVIEVDRLVAEQIFLSLPFKVLCSETCRGICPGCGVNLNLEPCRCKTDSKGSAFAKLESLKSKLPDAKIPED